MQLINLRYIIGCFESLKILVSLSIFLFRLFFYIFANVFQVTGDHETLLQNTPEYIAAVEQIKTGTEECLKIRKAA